MTNGEVDCYSLTDQNSEIQEACALPRVTCIKSVDKIL